MKRTQREREAPAAVAEVAVTLRRILDDLNATYSATSDAVVRDDLRAAMESLRAIYQGVLARPAGPDVGITPSGSPP